MPMPPTPPRTGCIEHHLIWYDGEPIVKIGCAHCSYVRDHLDLSQTTPPEQVRQFIESSRAAHARLCGKRRHSPVNRRRKT